MKMNYVEVWKRFKVCSYYVLVFGLMAHAFRYFNTMFTHDSVVRLYINEGNLLHKMSLGRFAHAIYMPIRNLYATPWLIGLLSLFFVSATLFLLVELFSVENRFLIILLAGILATNYSLALLNASYIYVADVYMFAVFLYTASAYSLIKHKYGYLFGGIGIAFALGLYQSYISVTLLIILFWIVFSAYNNQELKMYMRLALRTFIMFFSAYFLYKLGIYISLRKYNTELSSDYNGIASVGNYSNHNVVDLLGATYKYVINFFLEETSYNTPILKYATIILGVLLAILLLICFVKNNINFFNKMIIIFSIVCMPFAMNCVYFLTKGEIHGLMIYSFCFVYILLLLVLDYINKHNIIGHQKIKDVIHISCIVLLGIILFRNIVYSNDIYLKKQLEYEDTQLIYNRIITKIEELDDYQVSKETEIVFIGLMKDSPLCYQREEFEPFSDSVGLTWPFSVTSYNKYQPYFDYVLNYPIDVVDQEVVNQYIKKNEVKEMPVFPYEGSVRMIDGRVVVKVAELDE